MKSMLCILCRWYMCDRWVLSRCDLIDQVLQKREQSARESETFLNQGSLTSPGSWRERLEMSSVLRECRWWGS